MCQQAADTSSYSLLRACNDPPNVCSVRTHAEPDSLINPLLSSLSQTRTLHALAVNHKTGKTQPETYVARVPQ